MERDVYLRKCQAASFKTDFKGAWWAVNWDESDLVKFRGDVYVPYDYRFGFIEGKPTHIAIIHSVKTNSETQALLSMIEDA